MNLENVDFNQVPQGEELQMESSISSHQYANNSISSPRQGESATQTRFRVERLFSIGSAWYFSTREGRDQGPFISKEQAHKAISVYIMSVKN